MERRAQNTLNWYGYSVSASTERQRLSKGIHGLASHQTSGVQFLRRRKPLRRLLLAILAFAALAPSQLRAQSAHSLTQRPSITLVGTNDDDCHEAVKQLQGFIGEFPFVRGHHIYVVCDNAAWQRVLHHFILGYGVIVNSRAAISDIRLRETWFYATALRKGSDGKPGEYIYAHELGHFVCGCIDEAAAHKAAVQLVNDAHSRSQAPVSGALPAHQPPQKM